MAGATDNFGFAQWVRDHADELVEVLGEGHHFGEWWGKGIQRGYGLSEKRFSLFNTKRWGYHYDGRGRVGPCSVVPTLYRGPLERFGVLVGVQDSLRNLSLGSVAATGFPKPEGIVIFHEASQQMFKKTIEKDEEPKGKVVMAKTHGNYVDALLASGKEAMEHHAADVLNKAFELESLGRAVARLVPDLEVPMSPAQRDIIDDAFPGATETTMGGR
jgi:hypothetical protein